MRLTVLLLAAATLVGCASQNYAQITGSTPLHDEATARTICRGEVARTPDEARGSNRAIEEGCMAREGYGAVR